MFCRNCGKDFAEAEGTCPFCGMPAGEGQHHCPLCGSRAEEHSAFCTNCGAPLAKAEPAAAEPGSQTGTDDTAEAANRMPPPPPGYMPPYGSAGYQRPTQNNYANVPPYPPKSKLAAILLAVFLGGFGIHNFYLGYNDKGLWQLILGILCCGTISWVWALVEAVLILCNTITTDAYGVPLSN